MAGLLEEPEKDLFWSQQLTDLRHAHDCARYVSDRMPDRRDLARAALLHDLGKQRSRLGPIGRSIATLLAAVGIRGSSRHASYTRHAHEGAAFLADAGAERLVVAYTRHHHEERPAWFAADEWDLLMTADRVS